MVGETPMSIARALTGDPRRYGELVLANPHKPVREETFASLVEGEYLFLPPSWAAKKARGLGAEPPPLVAPVPPVFSPQSHGQELSDGYPEGQPVVDQVCWTTSGAREQRRIYAQQIVDYVGQYGCDNSNALTILLTYFQQLFSDCPVGSTFPEVTGLYDQVTVDTIQLTLGMGIAVPPACTSGIRANY